MVVLQGSIFTTFGILKGFLAAYSHNFTIFLSFGWPFCKTKFKVQLHILANDKNGNFHYFSLIDEVKHVIHWKEYQLLHVVPEVAFIFR